jgi:hypothetical protein
LTLRPEVVELVGTRLERALLLEVAAHLRGSDRRGHGARLLLVKLLQPLLLIPIELAHPQVR